MRSTARVRFLHLFAICLSLLQAAVATDKRSSDLPHSQSSSHWNDNQKRLNVLLLSTQASGTMAVPLALGEELVQRGHNVTLCMSGDKYQAAAEKKGLRYKSNGPSHDFGQYGKAAMDDIGVITNWKMILATREGSRKEVENFLKLFKEGQLDTKWDIIIVVELLGALLPCLSELLQVPVILLHNTPQLYPHTYPSWPWSSYGLTANTDYMTFGSRLAYAIEMALATQLTSYIFNTIAADTVENMCPGQANTNLFAAFSTTIPDIVPTVIGVEISRTVSPLSQYVGPILTDNPEPCEGELETWLNSKADNSVIYISMGSITGVKKKMADAFIGGIKKTNYSILWALRKIEEFQLNVEPERLYTDKWLPQLAILRHRAIGLAIMHGGANGLHESLHSGVPLIIPSGMIEQRGNAGRVHHHRLGIHLDRDRLTAEQIYQSISEIDSGDYRQNVAKIQKVFRQAGGAKRAADLVEFYSEVGYDHLIPAYAKYQWSWVQYYNADVYALLLMIVLLIVYVDYRILKCICSKCCLSRKQKLE